MKTSQPTWFENLPGGKEGSLPLYCFPYAGGSAQVFRNWQRSFLPEISLTLVHLPGRGPRISEPPFKDLRPLVDALTTAILAGLPPVFAFWGHSMGGLISFELARELRRRGQPGPLALFVSGRSAPHIVDPDPPSFNLPDDEFIAELRRLKGTPEEVLASAELKEFFLPIIRADFELVETYVYREEAPLACPIYAYGGLQDTSVPAKNLKEWQKQTLQPCKLRMFRGDHFFIQTCPADVIPALRRDAFDLLSQGPTDHRPAQKVTQ